MISELMARVDSLRYWLFALAGAIAVIAIVLERSGHYGAPTHIANALVPLIFVLILLARGHQASKRALALVVSFPLVISAVIGLLIEPGYHPEVTALLILNAILVFAVGFPLGLYGDISVTRSDDTGVRADNGHST